MTWETGLIQQTEHPRPREGKMPESPPGEPYSGGPTPQRSHLLSQVMRLPAEGKHLLSSRRQWNPMGKYSKPGV